MTKPLISLEAAHAHERVIANHKGIPWKLPADQKHWRSLIDGHAIIVGDTTYKEQGTMEESFNVVISRQTDLQIPKGAVAASVEEAIKTASEHETEEIFVVGGASIFAQTIAQADRLYLTIIDLDVPDGIRFFPEYENDFHLIDDEPGQDNGLNFHFTVWERNR
jgi:dihydrofolate reductase